MSTHAEQKRDSGQRGGGNGSHRDDRLHHYTEHYVSDPASELMSRLRKYAYEKPDVAAMWCFGLGVFLGWKLRG